MKSETSKAPPSYSAGKNFEVELYFFTALYHPCPETDPKYTFFGGIHVMTGGKALSVLLLIFAIFRLREALFLFETDILATWNRIIIGPDIIALILLFVGLARGKSCFLVPYIIALVAKMAFFFILSCLCVYSHHSPDSSIAEAMQKSLHLKKEDQYKFISGSSYCLYWVTIYAFCWQTFLGCVDYLDDLELYIKKAEMKLATAPFPHDHIDYVLGSTLHVMNVGALIAVVLMIYYFFSIPDALFSPKADIVTTWNRITLGPEIICLFLLMEGLASKRSRSLYPFTYVLTVKMVFLLITFCLCVYSHHHPNSSIAGNIQKSLNPQLVGDDKFIKGASDFVHRLALYFISRDTFKRCISCLKAVEQLGHCSPRLERLGVRFSY